MKPAELFNLSAPVMPVANFTSIEHAGSCAELFAEAGVPAIEVTLRSPQAWDYFYLCKDIMRNAMVGVGTVTTTTQMELAVEHAAFAISPGFSPALFELAPNGYCYIPGVATASEVMQACAAGCEVLKLFPASVVGGVDALKAFSGPFPDVGFCPTGGISLANMNDYLALNNVLCVGGSWLIPSVRELAENRDALLADLRSLYQRQ